MPWKAPKSAATDLLTGFTARQPTMPETPTPDPLHPQDQQQEQPSGPDSSSLFGDFMDLPELHAQLAELQAKNAEIGEQYLRSQAEMQNTRRRADEEISKARKYAVESFAESMLPVADSLEASLAVKDASPQVIREGAEATLRQLKAALERNKVLQIDPPAGTRFDPHQHQAISVVPAEQEANTVVTVLQKGYSIAERVLRPALVTVTAPK